MFILILVNNFKTYKMKSKIHKYQKTNKQSVSNNLKKYYSHKIFLFAITIISLIACERELSDDATLSSNNKNPEVFIDTFSAGLGYGAFGGSKYTAFVVDTEVKYEGTASMRFDVPSVGDPNGGYAGGVFIDGAGRNLTDYDALTFYVKGSQAATLNEIGFGVDFGLDKYKVAMTNVSIGTNWQKITIPLPDALKLTKEKGMFWYSEGPENNLGYTFWIDNLKYEKLGTLAQQKATIFDGVDTNQQTAINAKIKIKGFTNTVNMASGINQTVVLGPSYFKFTSSNTNVATVNDFGEVSVTGTGISTIKASIKGINALGSLTLNSFGVLPAAPIPSQTQNNVKSIFSDFYTSETPIMVDPRFIGSTTGISTITTNNDSFLSYSNNNYTAILFDNKVDATNLSFMHVDVYAPQAGVQVKFQIRDAGANGILNTNENTGFPTEDDKEYRFTASGLTVNGWNSFDIPLIGDIINQKNNLKALIIVEGPNFILDNIYFYGIPTAPTVAAPTPTLPAANVISLFSNAYTNVPVDTWRTSWSAATFADVLIAGNATKEYSNLDFVGIETVNNQINATNMNFIHIDVWSENFTAFSLKLVDFGANAIFAGGDDTEHQINYTSPLKNQWISYDIPLSSFTGLTNRQHLAQYILVGKPQSTSKIYIDNLYFHN